jgi:hypothetical protein
VINIIITLIYLGTPVSYFPDSQFPDSPIYASGVLKMNDGFGEVLHSKSKSLLSFSGGGVEQLKL